MSDIEHIDMKRGYSASDTKYQTFFLLDIFFRAGHKRKGDCSLLTKKISTTSSAPKLITTCTHPFIKHSHGSDMDYNIDVQEKWERLIQQVMDILIASKGHSP